ncbi:ATP-binding protein [Endothiovibrio diazotrophicus]
MEVDNRSQVQREQIQLLLDNLPLALAVSLFNGAVLVLVQWSVVHPLGALLWYGALGLVSAFRFVQIRRIGGAPLADVSFEFRRDRFMVGVMLAGAVWGLASLLLFPAGDPSHQAFVAFAIAGMSAGAVSTLSPVRRAVNTFLLLALLPLILRFLIEYALTLSGLALAMAGMVTLFLLGVMTSARGIHANIVQNIELRVEAVQREAKLAHAMRQAESANRAKSAFLANMSHEIRTPMNGVIGALQLMAEGPLEAQQHDYLEVALESARLQVEVINGILDFSRIEAGQMQLEAIEFSPEAVVEEVLRQYRLRAEERGLELRRVFDPNFPARVIGDPGRLHQVLVNLVGNAVKFTEQGEVTVSAWPQADGLRFEVADTGIGIEREALPRLFRPFSQVDDSTTRRFGGTGLGLVICKELVEAMGGNIGVDSFPGRGSRFYFTLHCPIVASGTVGEEGGLVVEVARRPPHPLSSPAPPAKGGLAPRGRVLLVEDNRVNRMVAEGMLVQCGLTVECVDNGHDALACLEGEHYDAVLMDVQMPDLDGFSVTRRYRRWEAGRVGRRLPIIAMTANALPGDREACIEAGMDDYLAKPVQMEALRETLDRWLGVSPRPL